jgi:hypothetical protein
LGNNRLVYQKDIASKIYPPKSSFFSKKEKHKKPAIFVISRKKGKEQRPTPNLEIKKKTRKRFARHF